MLQVHAMLNLRCLAPLLLGLVLAAPPASAQPPAAPSASAEPAASTPAPPAQPAPSTAPAPAPTLVQEPETLPAAPAPATQERSSVGPVVSLVGFGITAAGVIVGSIAGGIAVSRTSTLKDECGGTVCPRSRQEDIDAAKNMAGLSTVSFVLAAIGAVVGVNGLLVWSADKPASSSSARVQWRPALGLTSAGIQGRF